MNAVLVAALTTALSSCMTDEVYDEITTELTLPHSGRPGAEIEVRKRFRFTYDPADARGVYFRNAYVQSLIPVDYDISWISALEVYVLKPSDDSAGPFDEELVLVARGVGFEPGSKVSDLDIVYEDDLRVFAGEDSRIMFSFVIRPSIWSRPFPESGVTISATAVIEIDI